MSPKSSAPPLLGDETFRRLSEQTARLPGNLHASTLWRWSTKGVRGRKLEVVKIGGVAHCSDEALERFLSAMNGTSPAEPVPPRRSTRERQRALKRAEKILDAAGI